MAIANSEQEVVTVRNRGGVLLERYDIDLFVHPNLGFSLAREHRSAMVNTDAEGFRLSDSPLGPVDSGSWLAAGGGGLVIGNSTAFGMATSGDSNTVASHLAALTGRRELNLGVVAGNSLQELVAAQPFLQSASHVVVFSGANDYWSMLSSRTPDSLFGPVFFEGAIASLTRVPLFDLAGLASGTPLHKDVGELPRGEVPPAPDFSDARPRVHTAARRQLGNLAALSRLIDDPARLLFALQPFAAPSTRAITDEEQANFDFQEPIFGRPENSAYEEHWGLYSGLLEAGCAELGVPFVNVSADRFSGFCFADHLHLTDEGNRQAAEMIHRVLVALPGGSAS